MKFIGSRKKIEDTDYWKIGAVEVMRWKLQWNEGDGGNT
jgi:hypothetical protein